MNADDSNHTPEPDPGNDRDDETGKKPDDATPPPDEGERLRDEGCAQAADNNPLFNLVTQHKLFLAIDEKGEATIDDAFDQTSLTTKFPHKGVCGAAVIGLVARGLIIPTGERRKSDRKFRHAGKNAVWTVPDRNRLPAIIREWEQKIADALGEGGAA